MTIEETEKLNQRIRRTLTPAEPAPQHVVEDGSRWVLIGEEADPAAAHRALMNTYSANAVARMPATGAQGSMFYAYGGTPPGMFPLGS